MRVGDDYVQKLANNIEYRLNLGSSDIRNMTRDEFRRTLARGYFSTKSYKYNQSEPTDLQIDTLGLYYGTNWGVLQRFSRGKSIKNVDRRYYMKRRSTGETYHPKSVKRNAKGRLYDESTGRFVRAK